MIKYTFLHAPVALSREQIQYFPSQWFFSVFGLCFQREKITREPALLKKLCSAIREGVTVDNCCDLFLAVEILYREEMEQYVHQEVSFTSILNDSPTNYF